MNRLVQLVCVLIVFVCTTAAFAQTSTSKIFGTWRISGIDIDHPKVERGQIEFYEKLMFAHNRCSTIKFLADGTLEFKSLQEKHPTPGKWRVTQEKKDTLRLAIEIGQVKEQLDIRFSGKELVIQGLLENTAIHYRSNSAPDPHLRFPIEVERAMMPGRLNRPLRIERR